MPLYTPQFDNITFGMARLEQDGYYYLYANVAGAQIPIQAIKLGVVDELVANAKAEAANKPDDPAPTS